MKILVCTDGSAHSKKTLEKASIIAKGCNVDDVAIIHVYERKLDYSSIPRGGTTITKSDMERFRVLDGEHIKERKKILSDALNFFKEKNINARTIFKIGHPSHTIVNVGCDENFDMIIVGGRGMGGLKKVFLGSVSSAVVQEAKNCSVLTVK